MPLHVVLYQPEIPQNTGNVARTCACTGAVLHLIHPLGFFLSDRHLRRAGLDYWHLVQVVEHPSWEAFRAAHPEARLWCAAPGTGVLYTDAAFQEGDFLVFGPESVGLPAAVLAAGRPLRIPMRPGARSLNLANAVAVVVYEALRQVRPAWWR